MTFQPINSVDDADKLLASNSVIFKHSERCGISKDRRKALASIDAKIHSVEVREQRNISDHIAESTGVSHESPQLLIIQDGDVETVQSHMAIDPKTVEDRVQNSAT